MILLFFIKATSVPKYVSLQINTIKPWFNKHLFNFLFIKYDTYFVFSTRKTKNLPFCRIIFSIYEYFKVFDVEEKMEVRAMIHFQVRIKKLYMYTKNLRLRRYGVTVKWLQQMVFVMSHHNGRYIQEVIPNTLTAVVELHSTISFPINILVSMEWSSQELFETHFIF